MSEIKCFDDLRVHRVLFIEDLLTVPRVLLPQQTSPPTIAYKFGSPSFFFLRVRAAGIVVDTPTNAIHIDPQDSENSIFYIDDASGVIGFRIRPQLLYTSRGQRLKKGIHVDVLGQLMEGSNTFGAERWIDCHGFDVKEDPIMDIMRPLETIKIYRQHYFSSIPSSGATKAEEQDKAPSNPYHPAKPGIAATTIPSKRPIEDDESGFQFATQWDVLEPARLTHPGSTAPPKLADIPREVNGDPANPKVNAEGDEEFMDDVMNSLSEDKDMGELLGVMDGQIGTDPLHADMEGFLRDKPGSTENALIERFSTFTPKQVQQAIQNLATAGMIYYMGDGYHLI
ncbi:hypothetical protein SpCBS45565_g08206 [Spizellomyces sp. 'palustris']|nr:hypothetical protein SpCBS45565_g08206 [Spizellomyces sp. 'palustris']